MERKSKWKPPLGMLIISAVVGCTPQTTPSVDINTDEDVVFYPTCAHLDEDGKTWNIPLHGIIYEPEGDSRRREFLAEEIGHMLQVQDETPEAQNLGRRIRLFLVDNERNQTIFVRVGEETCKCNSSEANGHFRATLRLSTEEVKRALAIQERESDDATLVFEAVTRNSDKRRFVGHVHLIEPTGLSIISDIDDTIKHTEVGNHKAVLENTFLRKFKPVSGMPELYRECASEGVAFHYISGSPWQLYLPLSEFLVAEEFPLGSFDLRQFRLKDPAALAGLVASPESTKLPAIKRILKAFPKRRFILIGDSGEQDPEIYAKVARAYEDQIVAILIRNVTDEDVTGRRFAAIRNEAGNVPFHSFKRPNELGPVISEIRRLHGVE